MTDPEIPASVRAAIDRRAGAITRVERLTGLSLARVWRVECGDASLIVKATPDVREARFYVDAAPKLRPLDVPIPRLEHIETVGPESWLVLEDARTPLPRERWGADPDIVHVLASLHGADIELPQAARFVPEWPTELHDATLEALPAPERVKTAGRLEALRREAQFLFEPVAWISGDPNPNNWGLRGDGTLALFDWERFTRAHPAIDLAIALPGLGSAATFAHMIEVYGAERPRIAPLPARALALAKLWTALEFLDNVAQGKTRPEVDIEWLKGALPEWLERELPAGKTSWPTT